MADTLINLVARIQLQNQILDTKINAWHHALTMIARVHKVFIEKPKKTLALQKTLGVNPLNN